MRYSGREGGIRLCSKLSYLKSFLDESSYTVALCGSGMMEEGGFIGVKKQERDYEIETAYGYSADEIFSSAFYNTRPELFFEFYKKEMLEHAPRATQSSPAMASLAVSYTHLVRGPRTSTPCTSTSSATAPTTLPTPESTTIPPAHRRRGCGKT